MGEYEPRGDIKWKKEKGFHGAVLTASEIDPVPGIKTSWVKDPRNLTTTRFDEFPDDSASRRIFISEVSTTFTIHGLANNSTPVEFEISRDRETDVMDCYLSIEVPGGTRIPVLLNIAYDSEGLFEKLTVLIIPELASDTQHEKELRDQYRKTPFENNIQELIDIYQAVGQSVFGTGTNSYDTFAKDFALELDLTLWKHNFDELTLIWTEEDRNLAISTIQEMSKMAVGLAGKDQLSEDDKTLMITLLTTRVLDMILMDYKMSESAKVDPELYPDIFTACVADIVFRYNLRLDSTSGIQVYIERSGTDSDKFSFSVSETRDIVGHILDLAKKVEITTGEEHRYEDHSYIIERLKNGNLSLKVKKLRGSSTYAINFILPEKVDIPRLYSVVSQPENQGWEKALDKLDASCDVKFPLPDF